jgi:hypothetical protein
MREGRNGGKLKSGGNNGGGRPKKLPSIIEMLFQEILAELGVDWEIFLDKLAENEIIIEKLVQTQFEFLKCPNKNAA